MKFDSPDDLRQAGFTGFHAIRELWNSGLAEVPESPGVYLIVRPGGAAPTFVAPSPAGRFKDRDPTLPYEELRADWVEECCVLYIGKAGGAGFKETLRRRLTTLLRIGHGYRAAHWGGRAIWQLGDADDLLVAWRAVTAEEPASMKRKLLAAFKAQYGRRPFANRVG